MPKKKATLYLQAIEMKMISFALFFFHRNIFELQTKKNTRYEYTVTICLLEHQ